MARQPKVLDEIPSPLLDNVIVKLEVNTETAGGILLPSGKCDSGIIVRISPQLVDDKDPNVSLGDKVYLPRGDTVGDLFAIDDKLYLCIPMNYVPVIMKKADIS